MSGARGLFPSHVVMVPDSGVHAMTAEEILHGAIEKKSPAERAAYLDAACGENRELRSQVEGLLQAHEEAGSFLEGPLFKPGMTVDYTPGPEKPGTVIGPYKLLQQLGEGGMGTVFLAEQTQPVQRKVAIKVIKPGMDSRQVLARFEQERQALAVMDHPNIAKVFDAGATDSGRPFFVMELVRGVPITQYCDQEHLTPKERLELFIPVCQAVQHAHQKGIIHRDLKPSNVPIALYDGKPVPKVIDFGVAKATRQKLTEKTMFTEVGQVVGTLEYMAPEQAELNNLDIDTRADIYALGTVLYELLAGSPPFTREQLKGVAFTEMLRMIREVEPSKPSTKLSSSAELPSLAAQRKLEPKRLTRLVQGDLDWIVMKCLEKDRARRYETANGLAQDIGRYLADEPVLAGPPSIGYKMRKFMRRNRGPVLAVMLVLLVLIGGITGTTWGLVEARRQGNAAATARDAEAERRKEAEDERDAKEKALAKSKENELKALAAAKAEAQQRSAAETEKQITQAVGEFLINDLLLQADPRDQANRLRTLGRTGDFKENPTVKELLKRAAASLTEKQIEQKFPNQPLVQANLLYTVGRAYHGIGEYPQAISYLKRAAELRKTHLGSEHLDTVEILHALTGAYLSDGKTAEAIELLEKVRDARIAKLGPENPDTLITLDSLAVAYSRDGQMAKAIDLFERVQRVMTAKLGPEDPDTLTTLDNLAVAYLRDGQFAKAIALLERLQKTMIAKFSPEHPDALAALSNLAAAYWKDGKLDKSIPLFEQLLPKHIKILGVDHPDTVLCAVNLAVNYRDAQRLQDATKLIDEWLPRSRAKLVVGHPLIQFTQRSAVSIYEASGQFARAAEVGAELLNVLRKQLPSDDPRLAGVLAQHGLTLLKADKPADAEPILRECLAIRTKKEPEAWTTFGTKSMLGGSLLGQKKYADAEPLLLEGYDGMKQREAKIPVPTKIRMTEALERLVQLYDDWGKKEKADEWRKKLEEAKAAAKPPAKQR